MPFKDKKKSKAYHKAYSAKWEKKARRWYRPERQKYCHDRYVPGSSTEIMRKSVYGVSPEEYTAKVRKQNNRCALCRRKERIICKRTGKPYALSLDHDHKTGKVRDLLCAHCNRALGLLDENLRLLRKAIQYLKKHNRSK